MVIGALAASLWVRPLPLERVYFVGGVGSYVVSMTSRNGGSRLGGMGGVGYVLNPDAVSPWSIEARYIKVRSSHDSLKGFIPFVLSRQF